MKTFISQLTGLCVTATIIISCSEGIGGLAGVGGSGYVASGSISGFGSVYVNGIKFETDSAEFEVEDMQASQSSLSLGMVVNISGTINPDGMSGTATKVSYGGQLQGPVEPVKGESTIIENTDKTTKTFSVLATKVIVDKLETVFDGDAFSYDVIRLNNLVEISGHYDHNGVLRATYIKRESAVFNNDDKVEVTGVIKQLSGTDFKANNIMIDAASANIHGFENGLENGVNVEVKGIYDSFSQTIIAKQVKAKKISYVDNKKLSIEGYITRYVSESDFDINGITVNADNAVFKPQTLQLALGAKLEAEGRFNNAVFVASKIETQDSKVLVHAQVDSVDAIARKLTLKPFVNNASVITVMVNNATSMEDKAMNEKSFNLYGLRQGDFVEVNGFETAVSTISALKVKRKPVGDVLIEGCANAVSGNKANGTISILGVAFKINQPESHYENKDESPMTDMEIDNLLNTIKVTPVLLKMIDTDANEIANEIDIE